MENYIVINGRKAELTPEQLKALGIEGKKKNPVARGNFPQVYYTLTYTGNIQSFYDWGDDNRRLLDCLAVGNHCTDRQTMIQRGWHETLNRLLWHYSMEHEGNELVWDAADYHYYVYYSHYHQCWMVGNDGNTQDIGKTYFIDEQTAQDAIREIIEPFMAAHPDFKLG